MPRPADSLEQKYEEFLETLSRRVDMVIEEELHRRMDRSEGGANASRSQVQLAHTLLGPWGDGTTVGDVLREAIRRLDKIGGSPRLTGKLEQLLRGVAEWHGTVGALDILSKNDRSL